MTGASAAVSLWSVTLALYFAPLLLLLGLLLRGRFVGEERILARRPTPFSGRPRRAPRSIPRPASSRPLVSLLARPVHVERGPPVALAPAA